MIKQIANLRKELEIEFRLSDEEIAYFKQIKSSDDLKNYKNYQGIDGDLVYDAAIALGLPEEEAEKVFEDSSNITPPSISEELITEYKALVRDVNLLHDIVYDAEYQAVEEVSSEGFASNETRNKAQKVRAQLSEAERKLAVFKYENSDFVARYKAIKSQEKESRNKEMFERFWNN